VDISVYDSTGAKKTTAASHVHAAADITSGTIATARLGSGTADGTTYLRGDQTWATPASGSTIIGCACYRSSTQTSITHSSWVALQWNAEVWDSDGFHDNSSNPSRLTIPAGKGGYYYLSAIISIEGCTNNRFGITACVNGTNITTSGQTAARNSVMINADQSFSCVLNLSAADYVELKVYCEGANGTLRYDTSTAYKYAVPQIQLFKLA